MLGIDLSNPESSKAALKKWIVSIHDFVKTLFLRLGSDFEIQAKRHISAYVRSARSGKFSPDSYGDSQASVSETISSDVKTNFGFPLIVVGCKSDILDSDDASTVKENREFQGYLRHFCHQFGAALVYTSAVNDNNCLKLRKYIMHRLYPETVQMDLELSVNPNLNNYC